jgi:hypothetical protein
MYMSKGNNIKNTEGGMKKAGTMKMKVLKNGEIGYYQFNGRNWVRLYEDRPWTNDLDRINKFKADMIAEEKAYADYHDTGEPDVIR